MLSTTGKTQNNRGLLKRFFANRRGTVAIEFAMIAVPFFVMIFAIFEVGLSFTAQQVMSNATDDIARQIRTGQLRAGDLDMDKLKARICARLLMPEAGCPNLFVDLKSYSKFSLVPLTLPLTSNGDVDSSGFTVLPEGTGKIHQLRVFYRWPIITDLMKPRIAGIEGTGRTLLFSSDTWQNEHYL